MNMTQSSDRTSTKLGIATVAVQPMILPVSRVLRGVGTTGDAGYCGVKKPVGQPVERGLNTWLYIPIVWNVGRNCDANIKPFRRISSRMAVRTYEEAVS